MTIPSSVNRQRALKNISIYKNFLNKLLVWKSFLNIQRPDLKDMEVYLSPRALPDLLTDGLSNLTVLEFLNFDCTVTLKEETDQMEVDMVPIVDFLRDDQLNEAFRRIDHILDCFLDGITEEEKDASAL